MSTIAIIGMIIFSCIFCLVLLVLGMLALVIASEYQEVNPNAKIKKNKSQ